MPNRIIRESILSSEKVALLSWPEEVFYRRLQSVVDDYGRYEANPQLLRSRCYPLQTDDVRVTDISRWMAACQKAGLILCYADQGKQYLEVLNFGQQQRSASKYPAPDSKCYQALADAHLGVSVFGGVSEGVGVPAASPPASAQPVEKSKTKARKSVKTGLPEDFGVSDRVRAWAAEKGFGQLDKHLESFVSKCKAKGYSYVDWDEAFMNAIRDDWAKLRVGGKDAPSAADPDSRAAVEAEGVAKGIGPWDDSKEHWPTYKARVRGNPAPAFNASIASMVARGLAREGA
jgi:hypothetical protein